MLPRRESWQWVVKGSVDVDIGANPSAEGGEDEGVDDQAVKVVDIVDTFRLQVESRVSSLSVCCRVHWTVGIHRCVWMLAGTTAL